MKSRFVTAALLSLVAIAPAVADTGPEAVEGEKKKWYRRGDLRLGVFFATRIDTRIAIGAKGFPLAAGVDVSSDLGLKDSTIVPRVHLAYRFSKRHRFDFGWYRIDRSGTKVLERTIEIGDKVFEIGTEVDSFIDTELLKFAYTWLFYDESKVTLGLSVGIHFTDLDFGIASTDPILDLDEDAGFLAPLPMLGGRLIYRVTPKLMVVGSVDLLFLNVNAYRGSLVDAEAIIEHRTFKHVGFGGGWNRLALDLDVDSERYFGYARHILSGWMVYTSIYF